MISLYSVCQGSSLGPPCFNRYLKCYKNVSKDDDDLTYVGNNKHNCNEGCSDESKISTIYFADDILKTISSKCPIEVFKRS